MRSFNLPRVAYSALLFGCVTAYAQTPPTTPADAPTMAQNSATPDTTGNDLRNGATRPSGETLATVRSSGEDKADGNDLVAGDNRSDQETGTHPAFKSLDTKKNGYLTADDLKSHKWLSKNFSRCNLGHDGHLTQEEYSNCNK